MPFRALTHDVEMHDGWAWIHEVTTGIYLYELI